MFDLSTITLLDILPFVAVGFAAQMIDGALGMAFGVISTTLLVSIGVPPAAASAGVHTVETFTTGVSGIGQSSTATSTGSCWRGSPSPASSAACWALTC